MKEGYIKQDNRKKILLLTDDIRVHSGVAQIGREIISKTSHRYNWCQLAGSVSHPEKGKVQDISADINKQEELPQGVGRKGFILIPDTLNPRIKANLDFYLSKAGLIDKTRAPKYKDKSIKRNM